MLTSDVAIIAPSHWGKQVPLLDKTTGYLILVEYFHKVTKNFSNRQQDPVIFHKVKVNCYAQIYSSGKMVMQKNITPRASGMTSRASDTAGNNYAERNMAESVTVQHSNRRTKESSGLLKIILGGVFIVVSVSILVIGQLHSLMTDENTLSTPSGKYRLGQVYGEELSSELLITRVSDNGQLLKVNAKPDEVYPQAIEKVLYYIQQINDKAHPDNSSAYVPVEFSSAMWNSDIRVKLVTFVTYQSQYHETLRIVMDSSDRIIKKDQASIKPILDEMKEYGPKILNKYQKGYSFIR